MRHRAADARVRRAGGGLMFIGLLVMVPLAIALLQPQSTLTLVLNGLLALVGAVIALLMSRMSRSRGQAYGLLSLVLVLGTALQLVDAAAPPTRLDFATVRMKDGDVTDGYFLGGNGDTIYVAPNVADRLVGTVAALPRRDIAALSLERGDAVSALRGEINRTLVGGGSRAAPGQQERQDDLYGFLAGIRANSGWIHPPVLAYSSTQFLKHHNEDYTLEARPRERGHPVVDVSNLVIDPQLFTGDDPDDYVDTESFESSQVAPFAIRGRLIETAVVHRDRPARTEQRLFVIAASPAARSEANCDVVVSASAPYRVGQTVELLGIAVAWGRFNARAGRPVDEVALTCSTVRSVRRR
jgi:hypothetical protein